MSFHLPADELEKLRRMASRDGVTIATYVRRFLSDLNAGDDEKEEARQEGYLRGYRTGFEAARRRYQLRVPCSICRELITVEPESARRPSVIRGFHEIGWGHRVCVLRRQNRR